MARQIVLTVEVIEPYSAETLDAFGVQAGTAEEYAFCLGWQDGVTNHLPPLAPVTDNHAIYYQSGWALGSLNRIVWLVQSARTAMANAE